MLARTGVYDDGHGDHQRRAPKHIRFTWLSIWRTSKDGAVRPSHRKMETETSCRGTNHPLDNYIGRTAGNSRDCRWLSRGRSFPDRFWHQLEHHGDSKHDSQAGPRTEEMTSRKGSRSFRNVSVSRTGEQIYSPDEGTASSRVRTDSSHITPHTPEEVFRSEGTGERQREIACHSAPGGEDVSPGELARTHAWRRCSTCARPGAGEQR